MEVDTEFIVLDVIDSQECTSSYSEEVEEVEVEESLELLKTQKEGYEKLLEEWKKEVINNSWSQHRYDTSRTFVESKLRGINNRINGIEK